MPRKPPKLEPVAPHLAAPPEPTPEQRAARGALSLRRAARFCGVTAETLRKAVAAGKLPVVRLKGVSNRPLILLNDLRRLFAAAIREGVR